MKIITAILRRIAVFAAVLLALWAALVAAAAIPNERIYDNMYESALFFKDHAPYVNESQLRLVQDNYADVILLNVTWNRQRRELGLLLHSCGNSAQQRLLPILARNGGSDTAVHAVHRH